MNQYLAICNIRNLLKEAITLSKDEKVSGKLETIDKELSYFLQKDIDFKEVVDGVDDSIFITDAKGNVLYVTRLTQKIPH